MSLQTAWFQEIQVPISQYNDALHKDGIVSSLGKPLIARRGEIMVHHYAHKHVGDRDGWLDPIMTEWHRKWQNLVKMDHLERRIEKDGKLHIADIYTKDDLVVELQYSRITREIAVERGQFYGNMIWVFDMKQHVSLIHELSIQGKYELYSSHVVQKQVDKQVYRDVGTHLIKVLWISKYCFFGETVSYIDFITTYFDGITVSDKYPQWVLAGKTWDKAHIDSCATQAVVRDNVLYLETNGPDDEVTKKVVSKYRNIVYSSMLGKKDSVVTPLGQKDTIVGPSVAVEKRSLQEKSFLDNNLQLLRRKTPAIEQARLRLHKLLGNSATLNKTRFTVYSNYVVNKKNELVEAKTFNPLIHSFYFDAFLVHYEQRCIIEIGDSTEIPLFQEKLTYVRDKLSLIPVNGKVLPLKFFILSPTWDDKVELQSQLLEIQEL